MLGATIVIAAGVSQAIDKWVGLPKPRAIYRRIGPEKGPQSFCAGSSLLQFALAWSDVSAALGQGIESWGVGGSSPVEWAVFQQSATNVNCTILGLSVYDLNEHHLCDSGPAIVPITQTLQDLWRSSPDWQFSKRVISRYPLACLRKFFPTAARSDAVLVGVRRKFRKEIKAASNLKEQPGALVLSNKPIMDFGELTDKVSDWSEARTLRRVALQSSEIRGQHRFDGPKSLALERILEKAKGQGRVILVVLPVSPLYKARLMNPEVVAAFENAFTKLRGAVPEALVVRLDQVPSLDSNDYYTDLVHLNSAGRKIATAAFLQQLKRGFALK